MNPLYPPPCNPISPSTTSSGASAFLSASSGRQTLLKPNNKKKLVSPQNTSQTYPKPPPSIPPPNPYLNMTFADSDDFSAILHPPPHIAPLNLFPHPPPNTHPDDPRRSHPTLSPISLAPPLSNLSVELPSSSPPPKTNRPSQLCPPSIQNPTAPTPPKIPQLPTLHSKRRRAFPKSRIARISIGPQQNTPDIPSYTHSPPPNTLHSQKSLAAAVDGIFLLPVKPSSNKTNPSLLYPSTTISSTTISSANTSSSIQNIPNQINPSSSLLLPLPAITPLAKEEIKTGIPPRVPRNRDSYAGDDPILGSYRVLLEHMSAQLSCDLYQNNSEGNTNWKVPTTPMRFEKFSPTNPPIDPKRQQLTQLSKKHKSRHRRRKHHKPSSRKPYTLSPISLDTFFPQNTLGHSAAASTEYHSPPKPPIDTAATPASSISIPSKLRIRLENGKVIHHDISTSTTAAAAARMLSSMPIPRKRPLDFDLDDDGDLRELHNSLAQQHTFFAHASGSPSSHSPNYPAPALPGPMMTLDNVQFKPLSSFRYIGPELSSKLVWILHVHFDAIRRARMAPLDVFKRVNAAFVEYFGAMVNVLVERTWAFDYIYVILLEFTTHSTPNGLVAVASMCGLLCKMFDAKHAASEVRAFEGRCFEHLLKLACGRADLQPSWLQPRKPSSLFKKPLNQVEQEDDLEIYAYPARVTLTYIFTRVRVTQVMVNRVVRIREQDDLFFKPRKIPLRCFVILWLKLIIAQFPENPDHTDDDDKLQIPNPSAPTPMLSGDILALDLTKDLVETSYREAEMIVALEHNTTARNLYYQVFPQLNMHSSRYPFLNTFTITQLLAILDTAPQGLLADVTQIILQYLRQAALVPQTPFKFDLEGIEEPTSHDQARLRNHFLHPAHCHKHCKHCRRYRKRYNYVVHHYQQQPAERPDQNTPCYRKLRLWLSCWNDGVHNYGSGGEEENLEKVPERLQRESMTTFDSEETTVCEAAKQAVVPAEEDDANKPSASSSSTSPSSVLTPILSPECTCPSRKSFGSGARFRRSGGSFCGSCDVDLKDADTWKEYATLDYEKLILNTAVLPDCQSFYGGGEEHDPGTVQDKKGLGLGRLMSLNVAKPIPSNPPRRRIFLRQEINVVGPEEDLIFPTTFQDEAACGTPCVGSESPQDKFEKWINEENQNTLETYCPLQETTRESPIEIQGLPLGPLRVTNRSPDKSPPSTTSRSALKQDDDGATKNTRCEPSTLKYNPSFSVVLPRPKLSVQTQGLVDPQNKPNQTTHLKDGRPQQQNSPLDSPVAAPRISSIYLAQNSLPSMSDTDRRPWSDDEGSTRSSRGKERGNVLSRLVKRARGKTNPPKARKSSTLMAASRAYGLRRELSARGARERSRERARERAQGRKQKRGLGHVTARHKSRRQEGPVRDWSVWQNRARWVDARQLADAVGPLRGNAGLGDPKGAGGFVRGGDLMAMVESALEPAGGGGYRAQPQQPRDLRAYRGVLLDEDPGPAAQGGYEERGPVRSTVQRRGGAFVRKRRANTSAVRGI